MAGHKNALEIEGQRFGRLTVLKRLPIDGSRVSKWECLCDCGAVVVKAGYLMNKGVIRSCGCLARDVTRQRSIKHGHATRGINSTYIVWGAMKARVLDPREPGYKNYGGRGIDMDPRWHEYENFLADMGDRPEGMSIDRIDNEKGYWKDNCRWATASQQARNRRNAVVITFRGQTKGLADWCDELGADYHRAHARLKKGYPLEFVFHPEPFPSTGSRGPWFMARTAPPT